MSSASARVSQLSSQLQNKGGPFGAGVGPGQMLEGEVVIVTGSGNGIGKSIAIIAAAHGAHVVITDLDPKKTQETVEIITGNGGSAIGFPGDVTAKDYGEKIVKATVDKFGKISHLVLNAGFTADKMTHTMSDDIFRLMLEVHLTAPFTLVRAAAPYMRIKNPEKRENKSIVTISSTSGLHGNAGQANYAAGKSGIIGMTKTWAKEFGPFGVRVNCVAFGSVATRLTAAKEGGEKITVGGQTVDLGIPGAMLKNPNASDDIPLRRQANPEEAAASVVMLLTPMASYVSGHVLETTGGRGI